MSEAFQGVYTLLSSSARTASPAAINGLLLIDPTRANTDARLQNNKVPEVEGLTVYMNVSAVSGSGSLQLIVEEIDPVSGAVQQIAATLAKQNTGLVLLKISPEIDTVAATANLVQVFMPLPYSWQIRVVHGTEDPMTYSLSCTLFGC